MKCSIASGSISSQKPAFFSLTLQSRSMIHRHTEIWTRERISFTFDPRDMLLNLKLVTVPNFCHFTFISLWMPLALFVISLVFSALISILYLVQVLSRLSTRASSSCSSSARSSMSSANRLVIFLPPMLTFPSCSSRASDMIRSRKMLKKVGDRRHPWFTPTVVLNHSSMLP